MSKEGEREGGKRERTKKSEAERVVAEGQKERGRVRERE